MPFIDDPLGNLVLRPESEVKEDEDFKLLSDELFSYLYGIYGGTDIRRYSIPVIDSTPETVATKAETDPSESNVEMTSPSTASEKTSK